MAERLVVGLTVLSIYLAAGTLVAYYSRRRARFSFEELAIAGRKLGGFLSAMTYAATTYSSFMIVGLVGFAYATGVGAYGFELVYFVATLFLLIIFSRRVWRLARERGWTTPGQMLADLAGSPRLAPLLAIIYLIALIPYASVQLKGVGEAVAGLAGYNQVGQYSQAYFWYLVGLILGVVVMVVWSGLAGVWSVAVTDALQGIWMLASALALLAWVAYALSGAGIGWRRVWEYLDEAGLARIGEGFWKLPVFLAFTLPWAFFAVTNPQVVQRLYMPKDERSLARMIVLFGVFGLTYTVIVTLIGLLARAGVEAGVIPLPANIGKDQVTPGLLSLANPLLAAVVFTSIVAASVSTADSILVTLASEAANDLASSEAGKRRAFYASLVLFAAAIVAVAAARVSYIVALSVLSSVMLLGLAPPTVALWSGLKPAPATVWASILLAPLIVGIGALYYGSPVKAFIATIYGVPLSGWILILSTLITLAGAAYGKSMAARKGASIQVEERHRPIH